MNGIDSLGSARLHTIGLILAGRSGTLRASGPADRTARLPRPRVVRQAGNLGAPDRSWACRCQNIRIPIERVGAPLAAGAGA